MEALGAFLLAALVLTGSPGPNTLSMVAVGASFGRGRGLGYMAGLNLGMALVIAIVGTGVSGALLAVPGLARVITGVAVLYFLYLAWRIATAPPLGTRTQAATTAPRWYAGVGLSLSNPKAYAAMGALYSGHALLPDSPVADAIWKALLIMGVICVVNLAWLLAGAELTRHLQSARVARAVNIGFAVLLLVSVAALAV